MVRIRTRASLRTWSLLAILLAVFLATSFTLAQEQPKSSATAETGETKESGHTMLWKVANTCLFASILGILIAKSAPSFFNARSADIQKAIKDATGLKISADFRYSESDRKLATLPDEVKRMKEEGAGIMERDRRRILEETKQELEHIHNSVIAETEAFRAEGRQDIRRHTAQLALAAAERRLSERLASGQLDNSIGDFLHLVEQGKN